MENKFLSLILSAGIFVVVFGGSYYFFGAYDASTEKTYYEQTNEEAKSFTESEELSQDSDNYIADNRSAIAEPEAQRTFAEPATEYLKSNYTPSQILTLVTRGKISLTCRGTAWVTKVFVVNPSFISTYDPQNNEWSFWENQEIKNQGMLFTSTDNNCELFDNYYDDINVQLYVDAVNDGVIELGE